MNNEMDKNRQIEHQRLTYHRRIFVAAVVKVFQNSDQNFILTRNSGKNFILTRV